jgi:hypothetical protein
MILTKQNGGVFSFVDKLRSNDEIKRIKEINRVTNQEKKICKIDHEGDPEGYNRCVENLQRKRALDLEKSNELGGIEKEKRTFLKKEIKKCKIRHSNSRKERKQCIKKAKRKAENVLNKKKYELKQNYNIGGELGEEGKINIEEQARQQREERERKINENNKKIKQGNKYEDEYEYPNFFALIFNLLEYGGKKYFDLMIKLNLAILGMFFGKLTENMNKGQLDVDAIFKNPEMKKLINQFVQVFAEMFGKILEASGDQLVKIAPVFMNSAYKISFKTTTNIGMAMVSAIRGVLSTIPFVGTFISILFIIQGAINAGTTITLNFLRMITKLSTAMVKITGKTQGPLVKVLEASKKVLDGVSKISKSSSKKTEEEENEERKQDEYLKKIDKQENKLLEKTKEEKEEKEDKKKATTNEDILKSIESKMPDLRKNIEELIPRVKEQLDKIPTLKEKILNDLRENNINIDNLLKLTQNEKIKEFFKTLLEKPNDEQKNFLKKVTSDNSKQYKQGGGKLNKKTHKIQRRNKKIYKKTKKPKIYKKLQKRKKTQKNKKQSHKIIYKCKSRKK